MIDLIKFQVFFVTLKTVTATANDNYLQIRETESEEERQKDREMRIITSICHLSLVVLHQFVSLFGWLLFLSIYWSPSHTIDWAHP